VFWHKFYILKVLMRAHSKINHTDQELLLLLRHSHIYLKVSIFKSHARAHDLKK